MRFNWAQVFFAPSCEKPAKRARYHCVSSFWKTTAIGWWPSSTELARPRTSPSLLSASACEVKAPTCTWEGPEAVLDVVGPVGMGSAGISAAGAAAGLAET